MQPAFDPTDHSHRRWSSSTLPWEARHALTGFLDLPAYRPIATIVGALFATAHRTKRPWQGQTEPPDFTKLPQYDEKCYLCPGNKRMGDDVNPPYTSTFLFENDFAAVKEQGVTFPDGTAPKDAGADATIQSLYQAEPARGKCYVICFSPRHDLTMAQLNTAEMLNVISAWQNLYKNVSEDLPWIRYIQIFENKGAMMGCSNPHPHGQAWSLSYIPSVADKELESQKAYSTKAEGRNLLLDYAQTELRSKSPRVVVESSHFAALVPYWALWPFEVMVVPTRRRIANLTELTSEEKQDLATVLQRTTCRYDNLFQCSFPYSMGIYQQPTLNDSEYKDSAQLHFTFNPPLLRSASVRKFLVGFELFGEPQRDLTAEQAAAKLRDCSETHYKARD